MSLRSRIRAADEFAAELNSMADDDKLALAPEVVRELGRVRDRISGAVEDIEELHQDLGDVF